MAAQGETVLKPVTKRKLRGGLRLFAEPQVMLVRMGRQVATYYGTYGRLDVAAGRLDLENATVRVTAQPVELAAPRLTVDLARTRLAAEGGVTVTEAGVTLTAERARALPSLARMTFSGTVRIRADNREAAEGLLGAGQF